MNDKNNTKKLMDTLIDACAAALNIKFDTESERESFFAHVQRMITFAKNIARRTKSSDE